MEQKMKRDWGQWEVIETGPFYKIKKLIINPGKAISKQYHNRRSETWCIVQGHGLLTIDDLDFAVRKGDAFIIEKGQWHQMTNTAFDDTDLIAIEVQMGEYCEEDDIVRE